MASILLVLLLGLFLQCTPSYSQTLCMLENAQTGKDFNFSVSPLQYKPNTNYTVTISGLQYNVSVVLSASMNNSTIWTWEKTALNCTGILTEMSVSLVEQWTSSSENNSNVEFRAYITMGNVTYLKTIILQSSSNMTTMNNEATTPKTTHASSNMTTMNNEATTPKTTHGNNNTTSSMINNTTTQISTSAAKKSTPQNAAGMVIGFKPLYAFTCMLLLLVTAPELLSQRV
ncbi:uncharacterized protein [Hemitrygon akajei]|uniref:uncharacterized protein isoform X2 n=1 Tax=Hemitrygon akajei TaxID=2704970 RepID=UPI003BF9D197